MMKKLRVRIENHRKICYNTNIKFHNGETKMTCFFNEAASRYRRIIALIAAFSAVFTLNMCRTMELVFIVTRPHCNSIVTDLSMLSIEKESRL